jgi:hypothetical protein
MADEGSSFMADEGSSFARSLAVSDKYVYSPQS